MNVKDRKKRADFLAKWTPYFIISCTLIGAALGSFIAYYFSGEFPYEVLTAGLIVTIILTVIEFIKQNRKKDDLPEADERVIRNVSRYFAYVSYIFLFILFVSLGVFTLLEKESIPILYLWIFFFSYLWITGIGSFIVKRR